MVENLKRYFDLEGRVAIVTGGSRGIGFAIAEALADAGAWIVIANRSEKEGQEAARKLVQEGVKAIAVPTDVSRKASVEEMVQRVLQEWGRIDILVNNAGIVVRGPVEAIAEEDLDRQYAINLKGLYLASVAVGRHMKAQKKGKIINISSVIAVMALPERGFYSATKAAVSQLTRSFALEWAPYHINVNAIAPGTIRTELNRAHFEAHPEDAKRLADAIPLKRLGVPQDISPLAIYLASDASDYVTGQTFLVDGGWSAV